jgi:hypothetical protein
MYFVYDWFRYSRLTRRANRFDAASGVSTGPDQCCVKTPGEIPEIPEIFHRR